MNCKLRGAFCSALLLYGVQAYANELFNLQSPAFADNALMEKKLVHRNLA